MVENSIASSWISSWTASRHLVHRGKQRHDTVQKLETALGSHDARIPAVPARRLPCHGHRLERFPVGQGPQARVLADQIVQVGGPRARQTGNDEGAIDLLVRDLGMPSEQILDPQPVREQLQHELLGAHAPERRKPGLGFERGQEHGEPLVEGIGAEVGEPRPAPGLCQQRLLLQRDEAPRERTPEPVAPAHRPRQARRGEIRDSNGARHMTLPSRRPA